MGAEAGDEVVLLNPSTEIALTSIQNRNKLNPKSIRRLQKQYKLYLGRDEMRALL